MRTTVTIDDDVFQAVKVQAETSGRRLGEVLSQLARRGLQATSTPQRKTSGLPVFEIRSNAKIIPSNRAAELLAED